MPHVPEHPPVTASPAGIVRDAFVRRVIHAEEVRRVHTYNDPNGEQGLVVRAALFRYVFVSKEELGDPDLQAGVRSLVEQVRGRATIDDDVEEFLDSGSDN